jgi:AcrR family transcriptional regulator
MTTINETPLPPRRSARERLLDAAAELFYAEGVQTVGIDRVIERAGVAKASLYSTFGSKEALVRAYLDQRHERTLGRLRAAAARQTDPREAILAVFDSQKATFANPEFHGCAFVAASVEAPTGGQIEQATASFRSDMREFFTGLAREAGAADATVLAMQLQLVYDGAVIAANLDREAGIASGARSAAAALLDAANV